VAEDAKQNPATIDPGEPARIDLSAATHCPDGVGAASRFRDVALVVLGHEFPVSAFELTTACPLNVGMWYVQAPLINAPSQLTSIQAPAQVSRGELLEYVVTILNPSDRPFQLEPCPVYTERLGDADAQTYRLNCAASEIAPHKSMRFGMTLRVPNDAPLGKTPLTWMAIIDDGRVAIADLATGGVSVQVTG
jgi:hypothetical protein